MQNNLNNLFKNASRHFFLFIAFYVSLIGLETQSFAQGCPVVQPEISAPAMVCPNSTTPPIITWTGDADRYRVVLSKETAPGSGIYTVCKSVTVIGRSILISDFHYTTFTTGVNYRVTVTPLCGTTALNSKMSATPLTIDPDSGCTTYGGIITNNIVLHVVPNSVCPSASIAVSKFPLYAPVTTTNTTTNTTTTTNIYGIVQVIPADLMGSTSGTNSTIMQNIPLATLSALTKSGITTCNNPVNPAGTATIINPTNGTINVNNFYGSMQTRALYNETFNVKIKTYSTTGPATAPVIGPGTITSDSSINAITTTQVNSVGSYNAATNKANQILRTIGRSLIARCSTITAANYYMYLTVENPILVPDPLGGTGARLANPATEQDPTVFPTTIFPNPFTQSFSIKYSVAENDTPVNITLHDMTGKVISNLQNSTEGSGEHLLEYDGSELAAGMYFCTIQIGSERSTMKLVKTN